jgi:tetratricopeptide (TPR) repeat protein
VDAGYARADRDALRTFSELLRGNFDRLPEFEEVMSRMSPLGLDSESPAYYLRYRVGQMLFDEGRLGEAERYFRSFYQYQWMYLVPSHYYLGQIYEELDRPEDALEHYRLFVEWWRDSDPELQRWWEEGRDALARLSGEPRETATP